jgi:thioredoxin reductase
MARPPARPPELRLEADNRFPCCRDAVPPDHAQHPLAGRGALRGLQELVPGRARRVLTSLPEVFAIGDVRGGSLKRVASAVGEGAIAIAFVHQALCE